MDASGDDYSPLIDYFCCESSEEAYEEHKIVEKPYLKICDQDNDNQHNHDE